MQEVANYKTEIEKNGVIAFVPRGNSMWPILKNRGQSVIIRKKTAEEKLAPLTVAFYERKSGAFVLHRVMSTRENGYVMCGDSQFTHEFVEESQVFGVMEGFYHGKKYIKVTNPKYIKKVKNWYKRKNWRKFCLKCFYFKNRVISKLKRIIKKCIKKGEGNV